MVVIRLSRSGAKKRPFYHITVADSRRARDGRHLERIGFFNPIAAGKEVELRVDHERVQHWITQGAQVSDRVRALIKQSQKPKPATPQKPSAPAQEKAQKAKESPAKPSAVEQPSTEQKVDKAEVKKAEKPTKSEKKAPEAQAANTPASPEATADSEAADAEKPSTDNTEETTT